MNRSNDIHRHDDHHEENLAPMPLHAHSRRYFLRRTAALGATGLLLPGLLTACGGENATESSGESGSSAVGSQCVENIDLSWRETMGREAVSYVDESPNPAQLCSNCRFYQPSDADAACGTCEIVAGPIAAAGYCSAWAVHSG
jgi:hypothetical protein